ncbi:hypothetical protein B296_00017409 [Ensete ventricosum]|uniref:Uncharacterized protein n=1 Tax=Ensete ventricosum TaxID=4639 RepID=A0A427B506_ENSVE|nr:hypothetical protein B296_00017409 [Ensete ventricosum]
MFANFFSEDRSSWLLIPNPKVGPSGRTGNVGGQEQKESGAILSAVVDWISILAGVDRMHVAGPKALPAGPPGGAEGPAAAVAHDEGGGPGDLAVGEEARAEGGAPLPRHCPFPEPSPLPQTSRRGCVERRKERAAASYGHCGCGQAEEIAVRGGERRHGNGVAGAGDVMVVAAFSAPPLSASAINVSLHATFYCALHHGRV